MFKSKNVGDSPSIVATKVARSVVMAAVPFTDALTGKSFCAGDVVADWNDDRVDEYARRGLVYRTALVGPSEVK